MKNDFRTLLCRIGTKQGKMAAPEGLEPSTRCLEGSCSIQLSYGTVGSF